MRLSTKGRFAVTAMIDVGLRQKAGPVSLNDISARHHISMSYLEQMFARLRRSGLVESTRGPGGGYTLARPARDISVADIITAVETTEDDEAPRAGAEDGVSAMTAQLWSELQARMLAYMQSISLEQLIEEQRALVGEPVAEEKPRIKRGIYRRPETRAPAAPAVPNSVFELGRLALAPR
jgi:Rrf2 family iron-sulfur cluster assembly transcriptional regulator